MSGSTLKTSAPKLRKDVRCKGCGKHGAKLDYAAAGERLMVAKTSLPVLMLDNALYIKSGYCPS